MIFDSVSSGREDINATDFYKALSHLGYTKERYDNLIQQLNEVDNSKNWNYPLERANGNYDNAVFLPEGEEKKILQKLKGSMVAQNSKI